MPYQLTTTPIGPISDAGTQALTEYVLTNTDTGEQALVIPEFGGVLLDLRLRAGDQLVQTLRAPGSAQALLVDETYASALLFPFPSRIRHGVYRFEGQEYALRMNESARGNAIHGLLHPQPLRVVRQETTPQHALLGLRFDHAGDSIGYPFPVQLDVTYVLTPGRLTLHYVITNTGTRRCPVAFGWHPYFTINEEPTDNLTLHLPATAAVTLDDAMLPTGQEPFSLSKPLALRDQVIDRPYVVKTAPGGVVETVLHSAQQGIALRIGQDDCFPYVVVFTPPRRDSVAIEPMTANVNAFNTGDGLLVLSPGEQTGGRCYVQIDTQ